MNLRQIVPSKIILGLILALFVIKGLFLSVLMPALQNPDEQIHYGTIQFQAEPKEKNWPIQQSPKRINNGSDISTYGLSEEIIRSAQSMQFDEIKFERQNIQDFSNPDTEKSIIQNKWKHYIDVYPANVSGNKSLYYTAAASLERVFSNDSIFVRMFLMRLLATLFGLGVVMLAYLTAQKIGFSERVSLLLTALIAFQPMFSVTAAQINIDIALIFSFSLFLYAGVSYLRSLDQPDTQATLGWALLTIGAAILGIFSKGPGIVLIAALFPLFAWGAYRKFRIPKTKFFVWLAITAITFIGLAFLIVPKSYLIGITNFTALSTFHSPIESLGAYFDKTLNQKDFRDTARSYWGNFGWLDSAIPGWILSVIRVIETVGFLGVLWYIFVPLFTAKWIPERIRDNQSDWLPPRQYIIFFLGMIVALQCAIRFYDWRIFDYTGQILIGQPGRYFLPTIIGHSIIIVTGIGFLISQKRYFIFTLKILTLVMILLQLYAIIDIILPRYYL